MVITVNKYYYYYTYVRIDDFCIRSTVLLRYQVFSCFFFFIINSLVQRKKKNNNNNNTHRLSTESQNKHFTRHRKNIEPDAYYVLRIKNEIKKNKKRYYIRGKVGGNWSEKFFLGGRRETVKFMTDKQKKMSLHWRFDRDRFAIKFYV